MKQEILKNNKKVDNAPEKINVEYKCQFNKHTDNDVAEAPKLLKMKGC